MILRRADQLTAGTMVNLKHERYPKGIFEVEMIKNSHEVGRLKITVFEQSTNWRTDLHLFPSDKVEIILQ